MACFAVEQLCFTIAPQRSLPLMVPTVGYCSLGWKLCVCVCVCVLVKVMSNSLRPHGLQPTRLLCPWDSPGKNSGVVAIPFSKKPSNPRDQTEVSHIADRFFTI